MADEKTMRDGAVDDVPEETLFGEEEIASVFEEEEDEDEVEEVEEVEEEVEEEEPEDKPKDRVFTQEEVNEIIGKARIKGREYEEDARLIEQMTGMPMRQVREYLENQQTDKLVEETGMPENEARRIVEDRMKVQYLEEQLVNITRSQQAQQMMMQYNSEKANYMHNPLVKKYEAEIDAVSQGGQRLGWEAAMRYVLGEKLVSGEVTDNIKATAQQKTLANVGKRSKIAPESGSSAGAPSRAVPKELRSLTREFGMDINEIADEYEKIQKKRGG